MVRTQIQLGQQQIEALREVSMESGKSIAELVRLGVDLYLNSCHRPSRKDQVQRAVGLAGAFSSGFRDVSLHHDRYLAEAFKK